MDILDRVSLTPAAVAAWQAFARRVAAALPAGLDPADIPDEQAEPLPTGELRVWVDVPGVGTVEMRLPASEWAWADGRN